MSPLSPSSWPPPLSTACTSWAWIAPDKLSLQMHHYRAGQQILASRVDKASCGDTVITRSRPSETIDGGKLAPA